MSETLICFKLYTGIYIKLNKNQLSLLTCLMYPCLLPALLFTGLLFANTVSLADSCNKNEPSLSVITVTDSEPCLNLKDVCIDQQQFVTCERQYISI